MSGSQAITNADGFGASRPCPSWVQWQIVFSIQSLTKAFRSAMPGDEFDFYGLANLIPVWCIFIGGPDLEIESKIQIHFRLRSAGNVSPTNHQPEFFARAVTCPRLSSSGQIVALP
jgi:hypothetical protein